MNDTDPRLKVFVDLFNIVYPEWEVYGRPSNDLQPQHVNFDANLRTYNGRCGPRAGGRVYYRVNAEKWESWEWPRRLQLVAHELAHVKHTDHSPEFWEQVADNFHVLQSNAERVEDIVGGSVDWEQARRHVVTNPKNSMVDNRVETAYERQLKLAEALDHPKDDIPPFNGMRLYIVHRMNNNDEVSIEPEKIEYDEHPVEELAQHFRARPRPGIEYDHGAYRIDPPKAQPNDDGTYEIVEGDKRAGIIHRGIIEGGNRELILLDLIDDDDSSSDAEAVASD